MSEKLLQACAVVLLAACGPYPVDEPGGGGGSKDSCLSLSGPGPAGLSTSPPSKVSWSFRVDTCSGEPVAGISATQFEIFEDGKKVSAFESQQRIAARGERFRLYSVVLLDLSGSILRSADFTALQTAAKTYLETALAAGGDGHRVQLMTFDGRVAPQVLVPFTSNLTTLELGLESLSHQECSVSADCAGFADHRTCAGWRCVDDSTNLNGAVVQSLQALDQARGQADVQWHDGALVVFTDGTDQADRVSTAEALAQVATSTEHAFAIGLGGEVDYAALRGIGRDGYWPVSRSDQLQRAFKEIADRVSGLANRFYVLEYCSPRRSGMHTLEVRASVPTAEHGVLTGSQRGTFDATGFESGCQL
ncbi:MAG: VWA domain-containing protein [Archangiaceae bacterium]|nr:VWA domain-containing protein [Archangiaceae bacterium]